MSQNLSTVVNFPPLRTPFSYEELDSISTLELLHLIGWEDPKVHAWVTQDPDYSLAARTIILERYSADSVEFDGNASYEGSLKRSSEKEDVLEDILPNLSSGGLASKAVLEDVSSEDALGEVLAESDKALEESAQCVTAERDELLKQVHDRAYASERAKRKRVLDEDYDELRRKEDTRRRLREDEVRAEAGNA